MKITFPPMNKGQDRWGIYVGGGPNVIEQPNARWRQCLYRSLMWLSDKAESFWHWTYYKAQEFAPPRKIEHVAPILYGYASSDGTIRLKEDE